MTSLCSRSWIVNSDWWDSSDMSGHSSLDFQLGIQKFSLPTSDGLHHWARVFKSIVSGCSGRSWMDCGVPLLTAHHWSLMSPWLCGHLIILRCIAGCFGVVVWNDLGHFGGGLEGALLGSRLLGLLQSAASCLWFSAACTLWPCGLHQPLQPLLWFSSGCVATWVRCRGFSP